MTALLALLEDLVVADFTAGDLAVVRRAKSSDDDASPVMQAKWFLDALAGVQKKKPQQVYVWAGNRLVAHVLKASPTVTSGHSSVRTILLQLNALIPKVVEGWLPDAAWPEFWGDLMGGDVVRIGFDGEEELAWLIEGAVGALAAHFGEQVDITRGFAKPSLKERRLVDVRAFPKPRGPVRPISAMPGLSSAGLRG